MSWKDLHKTTGIDDILKNLAEEIARLKFANINASALTQAMILKMAESITFTDPALKQATSPRFSWVINNGNVGTVTGAPFVDGKFGKALSLDGVDDDVTIADSISLRPAQITVASWVNPTAVGNFMIIASKNSGFSQGAYFMRIENTAEGKRFEFFITDGVSNIEAVSTTVATINTWFHVIGTYDGAQLKIYVNGVLERTVNTSITISYGTNEPLFLGRLAGGTNHLNGKIDEVRIYNRALTQDEISLIFSDNTPFSKGSVLWLKFDDQVSPTRDDSGGVMGYLDVNE